MFLWLISNYLHLDLDASFGIKHLIGSFRAYGIVSMCIGTGMGAAAVFEYPGP